MSDDLLARAKKEAIDRGITLTEFVADAVREALAGEVQHPEPPATPMPSYTPSPGREGVQPGVDLNDTAALLDRMEEADAAHRR